MCVRPLVRQFVRSSRSLLDLENGDTRAQTLKKGVPARHLVPDLRDRSRSGAMFTSWRPCPAVCVPVVKSRQQKLLNRYENMEETSLTG